MTPRSCVSPDSNLPPAPRESARRPRGVLVADDNEFIRAILDAGVRASGLTVWLAASGNEAVTCYHENRAEIDVLLLDVCMPDCDGPEALAAIRALAPTVPCCFMSSDLGHYTEEYLLGLGAVTVFQKPFRLPEMVGHLVRLATLTGTNES